MSILDPDRFGPMCDATLTSLEWVEAGRDVAIRLVIGDRTARRFTFTWVDHLNVSISQQEKGPSQPLSWNGKAERLPNGRVSVLLDFAGQGEISLECNEIFAADM